MRLLSLLLLLLLAACGRGDTHDAHGPATAPAEHADHMDTGAPADAEGAWARPVALAEADRPTSAVYFTLDNPGDAPLQLVAAETDVAGRTEIHETTMDGDVMRMRPVEAVDVPVRGEVAFQPGGLHVMLLDVRRDLVAGETFALTLRFADGGERTLDVTVRPATL
jgi:periplasmic copper chaperone A